MLIELDQVGYTYMTHSRVSKKAVSEVTIGVQAGEFIALIGPTGSGKSTLVQLMAGLIRPESGRVFFEGQDLWRDNKRLFERRRLVGLVFQEPEKQLFETTVEDDVAFWPRGAGFSAAVVMKMVRDALNAVGLNYEVYGRRSPFSLSGGEMRRAAIAGILVMKPRVLILDEPTAALDPSGRVELMDRLTELNRKGTAIILVSHDMDKVAEVAGRVVLFSEGRVVADGPPRRVFAESLLLEKMGLSLPQAARLSALLKDKGLPVNGTAITLNELEEEILTVLEKEIV